MNDHIKNMSEIAPSPRCLCSFLCMFLLLALSGCGHGGRVSVEGTVTVDGQPLEKGYIMFSPLPETKGPAAGGGIVNGKFAILSAGGPFAGNFKVQITAARFTGRKVLDLRSGTMIDEYDQYLPARYNRESQLEAEVTAKGPNRFEFVLTSK